MRQSPEEYEATQNFSIVTRWLHGRRFAIASSFLSRIAKDISEPMRVFEIGCGTGKLFGKLNPQFAIEYFGIDIDDAYIKAARQRYGHFPNFHVDVRSIAELPFIPEIGSADVVFALETFEHIPEFDLVRSIEAMSEAKPKWLVCSVPIEVGPAIVIKNVGSWLAGYVRHKEYTWRETLSAGCYNLDKLPPHGTGHKGFDWRWLAHTIRRNFQIVERHHLPLSFMPAAFSSSVCFIARSRR